ncbi:MAG: hypothetical protein A2Y59_06620 [Chloroflexi bacterium RBG_13_52_14]|nr:MAG: hypothetical protein A2Y59_06620 [Chloroflexi bacterium RBG_13_52_14]
MRKGLQNGESELQAEQTLIEKSPKNAWFGRSAKHCDKQTQQYARLLNAPVKTRQSVNFLDAVSL